MAYQDNVITRVDCKCENGVRVSYLNDQITSYGVPKETNEIVYYKENSRASYRADVLNKNDETGNMNNEERKQLTELQGGLQKIDIERNLELPLMQYCDVTESEMFGFKEISKNVLVSPDNGLWAYHGLRKFKFNFENLQEYADDYTIKANLIFDHRENDEMAAITSSDGDQL